MPRLTFRRIIVSFARGFSPISLVQGLGAAEAFYLKTGA